MTDLSKNKVKAKNIGSISLLYHAVSLGLTCGNSIPESLFGEECDGGEGCIYCKCDKSNNYVPIKPIRYNCQLSQNLSPQANIAIIAVSIVCTLFMLVIFVIFILYRTEKPFTGATPMFCFLTLVGSIQLTLSPTFLAQGTMAHSCMATIWLWGCGFIFLFGSVVVKTWRIERLFHVDITKKVQITDMDLLIYFSVLIVIELAILIPWTVASPLISTSTESQTMLGCSCNSSFLGFLIAQLSYGSVLLVAGCVLAFRVRNVPLANVREGMEILFSVYNFAILLVIIGAVVGSVNLLSLQVMLILVGLEFATVLSTLSLFGSKIYRVMLGRELWKDSKKTSSSSSRRPASDAKPSTSSIISD
eukprot:TRINITY_DN3713_c0_g2_i1.p1 TRINITY_DN3713_c0_g2~~TRINITY_DN3713_c0_g2_i1.p1  ORF type:complete len:371 (-),score=23.69 TRINITY_DN3713_c0_g2_i1:28-1110(-)